LGIERDVFQEAYFALVNSEKLELSEEEIKAIRSLKLETKKATIRQKAEAKVVDVDIKAQLYEDAIDPGQVNALIDKKYAIKAAKAKTYTQAYIQLKEKLGAEKWEKLRWMLMEEHRSK